MLFENFLIFRSCFRAKRFLASEKLSSAIYLPIDGNNNNNNSSNNSSKTDPGEQLVWQAVMKTFRSMSQHDFAEDSEKFDAYSMQYTMNSYFLARTRLCRIQQHEEDEGRLYLELNKLDGQSFTFYDQYRQKLTQCLANIGKEGVQEEEEEAKVDPFDFLDMTETSSQTIIDGWLHDIKVDDDLVYDANRVLGALSSLAWNCKNAENKAKLMQHSALILQRCIAILRELETNQVVTYFATVCIKEFTGEQFKNCSWEDIGVFCDVLKEWVKSSDEVKEDAQVNKTNELLIRDIPQSREIVKTVFSVLLKLQNVEMSGKPKRRIAQKFKILTEKQKFQFAEIEPETVETVEKLLKL